MACALLSKQGWRPGRSAVIVFSLTPVRHVYLPPRSVPEELCWQPFGARQEMEDGKMGSDEIRAWIYWLSRNHASGRRTPSGNFALHR